MIVVLDTNIIVASLSTKSKYHWIISGLKIGDFSIAVSNEILTEYEEIINIKYGTIISNAFLELLLNLENVKFVDIYYNWNLIKEDESDNKFVDCFISSGADYLITEDHHFNSLNNTLFPPIRIIGINKFKEIIT